MKLGGPLSDIESFAAQAARLLSDPRISSAADVESMLRLRGVRDKDMSLVMAAGVYMQELAAAYQSGDAAGVAAIGAELGRLGLTRYPVYVRAEIQPAGTVAPDEVNYQNLPVAEPLYRELRLTVPVSSQQPEVAALAQALLEQLASGADSGRSPPGGRLTGTQYHV